MVGLYLLPIRLHSVVLNNDAQGRLKPFYLYLLILILPITFLTACQYFEQATYGIKVLCVQRNLQYGDNGFHLTVTTINLWISYCRIVRNHLCS
jgi:hypothetical protein